MEDYINCARRSEQPNELNVTQNTPTRLAGAGREAPSPPIKDPKNHKAAGLPL
jgi:hypothetical protein